MLRYYRRLFGTVKLYRFNEAALNKLQILILLFLLVPLCGQRAEINVYGLQALHDTLENIDDISSISFDGTVLSAEIEPNQYIVINKHEASQQIWYSSFNGVDYFAREDGKWISRRSGRELSATVQGDVLKATGKLVDFNNTND
ncbi:iron donor protein, putative [Babesia ovis]|uniref:Iron donor protein, putative n=1 Tax=Babesia ovis TaxID=5869 RepID=A0A9W5T9N2_BABOV|nr:iron donor protein, putative [Babesia ovis]